MNDSSSSISLIATEITEQLTTEQIRSIRKLAASRAEGSHRAELGVAVVELNFADDAKAKKPATVSTAKTIDEEDITRALYEKPVQAQRPGNRGDEVLYVASATSTPLAIVRGPVTWPRDPVAIWLAMRSADSLFRRQEKPSPVATSAEVKSDVKAAELALAPVSAADAAAARERRIAEAELAAARGSEIRERTANWMTARGLECQAG